MTTPKHHTDIVRDGWIAKMPEGIQPYLFLMRLDRPIGTWLLFLPAAWSILYAGGIDAWCELSLFFLGAVIMRGAGCVVNDLWDRDLDGRVERTQNRPIPSGQISVKQAIRFLCGLLLCGFVILLQFNALTITLGILSLIFVGLYPLMKRWTWWPQAFLGLTFNFGALMGWSAVTGELSWQAWVLYAAGFFWTLGYDTIYAMQDREDDALIGIKSTARLFAERMQIDPRIPCLMFYMIHITLITALVTSLFEIVTWHYLTLVFPIAHLIWQVKTLSQTDPENALKRFKSNRDYGLLLCGVILFLS
jgi:4-hydroxybenzoate polyprenyltransferase